MSNDGKADINAALEAAKARRAAAAAHHPGVAQHVGPPQPGNPAANAAPYQEDADDKPVYSVKQVERMMAQNAANAGTPAGPGSLQQASLEALTREIQRRRDLAMSKLKDIPTEWLEVELERRRSAENNG